jgi:PAS domain S-box-containing protein
MTAPSVTGTTDRAPATPTPALDGHLLRIIAGGPKRASAAPPAPAARRRAARYRRFLDALGVAVYTTDSDGRITFFNAAAADLWGRSPALGEEWCGSLRLLYLDERPMRHDECPMATTLKEARPVRGGQASGSSDGSNVSSHGLPDTAFADDGELIGAVNVLVDITDRHRAEQAVRVLPTRSRRPTRLQDEPGLSFTSLTGDDDLRERGLLQTHGAELTDESAHR